MRKSELKAIIKECLDEFATTVPTTKSIKLRRNDLARGSRAAQRGHQQAIRLRNGLQEDDPAKRSKTPAVNKSGRPKLPVTGRFPNTKRDGHVTATDPLKGRVDLSNMVAKIPNRKYGNMVTKAHINQSRSNKGSERGAFTYVNGKRVKVKNVG